MAIAALVCAFLFAPLGIIFGHISLAQIKRTGEDGRGLALTGLIVGYVATALSIVFLVLMVLFLVALSQGIDNRPSGPVYTAAPPPPAQELPAFDPPQPLGTNCQYPATPAPASKKAAAPRSGRVPTDPATVGAGIETSRGNIGLTLHNAEAPCTVNNFSSLAQQGFFDGTTCHRLTNSPVLKILQCGDPSGTGEGGPGYRFPNEYPTNQYRLSDPALKQAVVYPRGTVAMANSGVGTNGSQFFLIYDDSRLPPTYTVFGTVDATGLATLDEIAADGVADGADDGPPAQDVTITQARLD
ncbi:peptidylprolyl isomerase [Mycobacterium manitobense]|uniref:Peptidyl-prolyl cis-trans isomerase n=2 Tax=[Mycobacterium] manitobense TaxID=190147 RepID=A0A9X3BSL9_9MYCO|nr:peptidylprolyl isomerase [[Mycobacterium] manitobense]MCV7168723.1 peptidylprolyl isomerase [[Mycobacterium] manitobense]